MSVDIVLSSFVCVRYGEGDRYGGDGITWTLSTGGSGSELAQEMRLRAIQSLKSLSRDTDWANGLLDAR